MRHLIISFLLCFLLFPVTSMAQQSGGGPDDDVKTACDISGGDWTSTSGGNWACCWSDWGCYGCVNGVCKIKCFNDRCRNANGIGRPAADQQAVPGLAPAGVKAPIVPKPKVMKAPVPAAIEMKQ